MERNYTNQNPEKYELISWSDVYKTGIPLIDKQHMELVNLTNKLYWACFTGEELQIAFKEIMSSLVEYVRLHFSAEIELLNRVNYPECAEHKKQHEELVRKILHAANEYSEGKHLVPHNFVRVLKDWIFSHIAIFDKNYSLYVKTQKNKGLLTDEQISG